MKQTQPQTVQNVVFIFFDIMRYSDSQPLLSPTLPSFSLIASNGKISIETIPDDNLTGIDAASNTNEKEVDVDEDGMEQEEMFVSPHLVLGTDKVEWGGPRRGGRFEEPTRFGDWERKGRCTDF